MENFYSGGKWELGNTLTNLSSSAIIVEASNASTSMNIEQP